MKHLNIFLTCLSLSMLVFMTSCSKENVDTDVVVEDDIDIETEIINELNCEMGTLIFESENLNFTSETEALFFESGGICNNPSNNRYNYIVAAQDLAGTTPMWGSEAPLSGFGFGSLDWSDSLPAVGDTMALYSWLHLSAPDGSLYEFDYQNAPTIIITEAGTAVGDNVAVTITGNMAALEAPFESIDFTVEVCSPIIESCIN